MKIAFKRKTVASVLKVFHKAVKDLENVIAEREQRMAAIDDQRWKLQDERNGAWAEIDAAEHARDQIQQLLPVAT